MKTMKHRVATSTLALLLALSAPLAQARVQVEGVEFVLAREVGGVRLDLEGAAVFRYLLFKVYAAALYLPAAAGEADALADDTARRLEVVYFRDVAAADLARAAETVLERTLPAPELDTLAPRIARLHGWYGDVTAGDRFALSYAPGRGTTLELNDRELGTIEGAEFARAYFAIWLGDAPIDENLRAALLAGRTGTSPERSRQ